jgi:hypothetical protein
VADFTVRHGHINICAIAILTVVLQKLETVVQVQMGIIALLWHANAGGLGNHTIVCSTEDNIFGLYGRLILENTNIQVFCAIFIARAGRGGWICRRSCYFCSILGAAGSRLLRISNNMLKSSNLTTTCL